ncbi:hypothetical protein [Oricola indica]|uniref:hypothetical protein n=1 Tax=Oricola indica TaxID=2872591 RepID=UPI003CCB785B
MDEVRLRLFDLLAVDGSSCSICRGRWPGGFARETIDKRLIAVFGILDRVLRIIAGKVLDPVLPQRCESANCCGIITLLKEVSQALAFRTTLHRVFRVIDIDLEFRRKELGKARVGEVQHETLPSDEVNEIIYKTEIDGSYRANKASPTAWENELAIY